MTTPVASGATLAALELPELLAMVASLAATDAGRFAIESLAPTADPGELGSRLDRLSEVARLTEDARLVPAADEPLRDAVEHLRSRRSDLTGPELLPQRFLLRAVLAARAAIAAAEPSCPAWAAAAAGLADLAPLARHFDRVLSARGTVRDDASPRLLRLAARGRRSREEAYRRLGEVVRERGSELSEDSVSVVGGRLVLLLRSGSKGRLDGVIHGRSSRGKSFYFEPLAAVAANNALEGALEAEAAERRRLLAELVTALWSARDDLAAYLDFLGTLDLAQAAAEFGRRAEAIVVYPSAAGEDLELVEARHPLLDPRLAELRQRALGQAGHCRPLVPLELELDRSRRVLVVTGPNAGGKTVALKTVGLVVLAAQCGLPVPVATGSRLPLFGRVFATVGDEQDLLADRSTFSARLARLREGWDAAGPDALLLIDELGSGTDPQEGGALAVALLEGLLERGAMAILTSHLGRLALAALEAEGAASAAMSFDRDGSRPTFRLQLGAPGASEALALARRLGLPARWIERAEELLGPQHRRLGELLDELEAERGELAAAREEAARERGKVAASRRQLAEEREELARERRELARETRRELRDFRRQVRAELDRRAAQLAGRRSGRGRERALSAAVDELLAAAPAAVAEPDEQPAPLEIGARVRHREWGWRGRIESIDGGRVTVLAGGKRFVCAADELAAETAAEAPPKVRIAASVPAAEGMAELKLLGLGVDDAIAALDPFLDRALLGSDAELRVVHGHGSGRLKRAVRERLSEHPAVASWRPAEPNRGGDGATIVTLRG